MNSLLPTIEAKSDQLNAEDLIGGPRTIKVTRVTVNTSEDQPVQVHFEGDNKKPFKPCKTVRKLMVQVWGENADDYAGKSLTIYLDPAVKFGGMAVGGIRVSHVSHIDGPRKFFLAETRGKKRQHIVQPLVQSQEMPSEPNPAEVAERKAAMISSINAADAPAHIIRNDDNYRRDLKALQNMDATAAADVEATLNEKEKAQKENA